MSPLCPGELRHVLESAWSRRGDEYLIERLRRVLVRQPDPSQLVVEIAELLQRYPFGLSGSEIARRLGRQKGRVLASLRDDSSFELVGTGRGTRYRVTRRDTVGPAEPQGTDSRATEPDAGTTSMLDTHNAAEVAERLVGGTTE